MQNPHNKLTHQQMLFKSVANRCAKILTTSWHISKVVFKSVITSVNLWNMTTVASLWTHHPHTSTCLVTSKCLCYLPNYIVTSVLRIFEYNSQFHLLELLNPNNRRFWILWEQTSVKNLWLFQKLKEPVIFAKEPGKNHGSWVIISFFKCFFFSRKECWLLSTQKLFGNELLYVKGESWVWVLLVFKNIPVRYDLRQYQPYTHTNLVWDWR